MEEIRRTEEGLTVLYEEKGIRSEQGADRVLIAVGRRPYTEGLFGEHTERPAAERGRILTDEYGRTSVPSLYACGDVTGGVMLAHPFNFTNCEKTWDLKDILTELKTASDAGGPLWAVSQMPQQ